MLLNIRVMGWSLGVFAAVTYILCVLYGLLVPTRLHGMSAFLGAVLPAFNWLTPWGFSLGLVESFLYGAYAGIVFAPLYNFFHKKFCGPSS